MKLSKERLKQIRESAKAYQKRADSGAWMETDGSRKELLGHIDALEKEIEDLKKLKGAK